MPCEVCGQVLSDLSEEKIQDIQSVVAARLQLIRKNLLDQAKDQENEAVYTKLVEYCTNKVSEYMKNPANLKEVLTNSSNIEKAYNEMTGTKEFEEIATEDFRRLPRVIAMTILAGSEAIAADEALILLDDRPDDEKQFLNNLVTRYQGYMQDAVAYGKGDDKKLAFTGEKQ